MKRYSLILLGLVVWVLPLRAQTEQFMNIHKQNGSVESTLLDNIERITFSEDNMLVKISGVENGINMDSIVKITFTENINTPIYGCNDFKALNYNPNVTNYDTLCIYADNTFNAEVEGTPVDTVGTEPIENCQIKTDLKIIDVKITKVDVIGTNQVKVYWEIEMENEITISYPVVYTVSQSGVTLFYLSIICKDGGDKPTPVKGGGVTGFTVSASAMVDLKGAGVNEITNDQLRITVYPNPTNEILYFTDETAFEIIDIQGKVLLKNETAVKFVNVSHLQSGIYLININHQIQKFIKR